MKKLNKKQKDHIKKILKRTLNIFCYICTALLALFLLIFSVQSCHSRNLKGVSAEGFNVNNRYSYTLLFDTDTHVDFESISDELVKAVGLPIGDIEGEAPVLRYQYYYYDLSSGTQLGLSSVNYVDIKHLKLTYFTLSDSDNEGVYWCLDKVSVYNDVEYTGYDILHKSGDNFLDSDDYSYYISDFNLIYSDLNFYSLPTISLLYQCNELSQFTFNKAFNYNAPLNTTIDGVYGTATFTGGSAVIKYINYDIGLFYSNGQLFNRIQYSCVTSDGLYGLVRTSSSDNPVITSLPVGYWVYSYMYYVNTDTNTMVLVNTHDSAPFTPSGSSGIARYYSNSSTWEIDSYRSIYMVDTLNSSDKNTLEKFNNNNQNSYSGNVISGDVDNIFTLIGGAFTGLLPVLSTYILPSITIGTLLFIPLVATLVFAIIRIIKK